MRLELERSDERRRDAIQDLEEELALFKAELGMLCCYMLPARDISKSDFQHPTMKPPQQKPRYFAKIVQYVGS